MSDRRSLVRGVGIPFQRRWFTSASEGIAERSNLKQLVWKGKSPQAGEGGFLHPPIIMLKSPCYLLRDVRCVYSLVALCVFGSRCNNQCKYSLKYLHIVSSLSLDNQSRESNAFRTYCISLTTSSIFRDASLVTSPFARAVASVITSATRT